MTTQIPLPVDLPMEQIAAFCQRWQITELALFGSVLRDDFGPESDIDVLVTYRPAQVLTISHWLTMEDELRIIFGRDVDLVSRRAIEESPNYLRRNAILGTAKAIYRAA